MAEKMLAYCGIVCSECPAFIGTQTNNREMLAETAQNWSSPEHKIAPEDILCDGCTTGKRLPRFCAWCEVRKCAQERQVANCGWCDDYPCTKLTGLWEMFKIREARTRLDEVKKSRGV